MNKIKPDFKKIIHQKMTSKDKVYGTTTMGARGQVVIPAQARKDLNLKPGDHLLVTGKFGKALGFIKVSEMEGFVKVMMENLAGSGMETMVKKHIEKMLQNIPLNKGS